MDLSPIKTTTAVPEKVETILNRLSYDTWCPGAGATNPEDDCYGPKCFLQHWALHYHGHLYWNSDALYEDPILQDLARRIALRDNDPQFDPMNCVAYIISLNDHHRNVNDFKADIRSLYQFAPERSA